MGGGMKKGRTRGTGVGLRRRGGAAAKCWRHEEGAEARLWGRRRFAWSFRVGGGQEDSMQGRGGVWAVQ